MTFLFISHHLQEVHEVCQAVTVLRDARHALTAPVADLTRTQLVDAMTGDTGGLTVVDAAERDRVAAGDALVVTDLSGDAFAHVSFRLRRGEVLGIAGSNASGKHQLAETIYGLRGRRGGGVVVAGRRLPAGDAAAALRAGIAVCRGTGTSRGSCSDCPSRTTRR